MSGRVVVLGSINVDVLASVGRLPNAGETVTGDALTRQLGGKGANQAVAVARAEAKSILIGATGSDADGAMMIETLSAHGVDTAHVAREAGPTGCAIVTTSPKDNQIVVIPGANARLTAHSSENLGIAAGDVCLAQMEVPPGAVAAFFERARAAGALTILNAAPASPAAGELLPLVDLLIVNETEFALVSGSAVDPKASDAQLAEALRGLGASRPETVIVTLGDAGLVVVAGDRLHRIAGRSVEVVDTTGAGDCFCGYLAAGLARGDSLVSAAFTANIAASIAVQALGAASSVPARSTILPAIHAAQPRDE